MSYAKDSIQCRGLEVQTVSVSESECAPYSRSTLAFFFTTSYYSNRNHCPTHKDEWQQRDLCNLSLLRQDHRNCIFIKREFLSEGWKGNVNVSLTKPQTKVKSQSKVPIHNWRQVFLSLGKKEERLAFLIWFFSKKWTQVCGLPGGSLWLRPQASSNFVLCHTLALSSRPIPISSFRRGLASQEWAGMNQYQLWQWSPTPPWARAHYSLRSTHMSIDPLLALKRGWAGKVCGFCMWKMEVNDRGGESQMNLLGSTSMNADDSEPAHLTQDN